MASKLKASLIDLGLWWCVIKMIYGVLDDAVIRPMSSCLRPKGIPGAAYKLQPDIPEGTSPGSDVNSMPARPGSLIMTCQGTRQLLNDESAKGLGTPKGWLTDHYPNSRPLIHTVLLHILEGLSPALLHNDAPALPAPASDPVESTDTPPTPSADELSFEWKPPDLSYGSPWYKGRVANLVATACTKVWSPFGPIRVSMMMLDLLPPSFNCCGGCSVRNTRSSFMKVVP
jgi:hypothetical protein